MSSPHRAPSASSPDVDPTAAKVGDVEQLFQEHNAALLRFIAAKLGSAQEAKEVAQEAYVRILSLDHAQTVSYLRAFLFKIAANLATDRLRQRVRRDFVTSACNLDLAVFELSPERQLEGEQAMQRLNAAIGELPRKCREAFLMYRLEGLSCREVAARLGLQERMVWLYVSRALEHLRSRVADDAESSRKGFAP